MKDNIIKILISNIYKNRGGATLGYALIQK